MCEIEWTDALAAGYVAGIIDGEGTVYYTERGGRMVNRRVGVSLVEKELLDVYVSACNFLGIFPWYYFRDFPSWRAAGKSPMHEAGISNRDDFEAILRLVPLGSVRKRKKLQHIVDTYRQRQPRRIGVPA